MSVANVPEHIAFIMDGNSRWAKQRGKSTSAGHRAGVESVREVLRLAIDNGVRIVTLYAFSSENWLRPKAEVSALMTLLGTYLKKEVKKLHEDNVQLRFIGRRDQLAKSLVKQMEQAEALTANNSKAVLVIAVDYGGQWDIANAAKQLAAQVQSGELALDDITPERLGDYVALADLPPPDLCVRTAGEQRISNFLLWQLAYAEFYFTETFWPDFSEKDMQELLAVYAGRERRFGARLESNNSAGA